MKFSFNEFEGFDWDEGNRDKNYIKHNVSNFECEEIFLNEPLIVLDDPGHSDSEKRFAAFGKTDDIRKLVIIYTLRNNKIRIISARDMNKKEKEFYNKYDQK
jgi:hypothetical protein